MEFDFSLITTFKIVFFNDLQGVVGLQVTIIFRKQMLIEK